MCCRRLPREEGTAVTRGTPTVHESGRRACLCGFELRKRCGETKSFAAARKTTDKRRRRRRVVDQREGRGIDR